MEEILCYDTSHNVLNIYYIFPDNSSLIIMLDLRIVFFFYIIDVVGRIISATVI